MLRAKTWLNIITMSKITCPNCNFANTCRVVYGMPDYTDRLERDLEAGKVHLGGCLVNDLDSNRHCNDCEIDFDTKAPNIYLDIDGVLLANDLTPANYVKEFLATVLEKYPYTIYWLTTHCDGDASVPIQHIGHLFDKETVELMRKIKPTSWQTAKTRAINFDKPFLWFDDDLFYEEKETLKKYNLLDNWIEVDLAKNPNQLAEFVTSLPLPIMSPKVVESIVGS